MSEIGERMCFNCFMENDMPVCPHCGYNDEENRAKYPFALPSGSVLNGQYIVGRVLGQGGFGITYLAFDYQLRIKVAIKEFLPEGMATRLPSTTLVTVFAGEKKENFDYGTERFLDEARVLAKFIGDKNIAAVRSYFMENNTAYFVMDYIEGISFKNYIKNNGGKVPYTDAMRVLIPVMNALSVVHREGIIHRDVTPDNIYITGNDEIKLLDFGSARYSLGDKSKSLDVILKAGYAPKEQYLRRGKQGPYTDVYSLAACFYASVTGYLPPEALERMDVDEIVPLSDCGLDIPENICYAVMKGLSVRNEDRWQNMDDFKAALTSTAPVVQNNYYGAPAQTPNAFGGNTGAYTGNYNANPVYNAPNTSGAYNQPASTAYNANTTGANNIAGANPVYNAPNTNGTYTQPVSTAYNANTTGANNITGANPVYNAPNTNGAYNQPVSTAYNANTTSANNIAGANPVYNAPNTNGTFNNQPADGNTYGAQYPAGNTQNVYQPVQPAAPVDAPAPVKPLFKDPQSAEPSAPIQPQSAGGNIKKFIGIGVSVLLVIILAIVIIIACTSGGNDRNSYGGDTTTSATTTKKPATTTSPLTKAPVTTTTVPEPLELIDTLEELYVQREMTAYLNVDGTDFDPNGYAETYNSGLISSMNSMANSIASNILDAAGSDGVQENRRFFEGKYFEIYDDNDDIYNKVVRYASNGRKAIFFIVVSNDYSAFNEIDGAIVTRPDNWEDKFFVMTGMTSTEAYVFVNAFEEITADTHVKNLSMGSSGDTYSGFMSGNKKNGWGKYTWTNGDYYIGEWDSENISGFGYYQYTSSTGTKCTYVGRCAASKSVVFDYLGILIVEGYYSYFGQFEDGERSGDGYQINEDGSYYVGEFKDGKFHGQGTWYYESGKVYRSGTFANGKFVS